MRAWQVHLVALGGIFILLLLIFIGVQKSVDMIYTEQPIASSMVGELLTPVSIGQTFVAEYDGLCRVELYLSTYGRHNTGPVVFHLRYPISSTDLLTITIDASEVSGNAYQVFEFSPLRDSRGQSFYFFLEAPQATPGNAIAIWGTTEDIYPNGEAIIQGIAQPKIRDLTFRLGYQSSLAEKINFLINRLAVNKPSLWGDRKFYVCLGLAYLVLLYTVLIKSAASGG